MTESEKFNPETEPKEKRVKEEYFKAWLEGNAMYPQMDAPINLLLAEQIANDPDYNSSELAYSTLSEQQLGRLQEILGLLHDKYDVRKMVYEEDMDEEEHEPEEVVVPNDLLQRNWRSTRKNMKNLMYRHDMEGFQNVLDIAGALLRSEEFKELAKKFREDLGKARIKEEKFELRNKLHYKIVERLDERLEEEGIDPHSPVVGKIYYWTRVTN